jgi:hypothetical protein
MTRLLCGEHEYPAPLLAVAGYGLPGAERPFPSDALDEMSWTAVLAEARKHRLTGLLSAAVGNGTFPATAAQVTEARTVHRHLLLRVMALERELVAIVDRLAEVGVESRVLKGSAVAHLDYRDPALRSFVDLDVLVRSIDIERAASELAAGGFRRTLPEPKPGFDRRFDKGMTLIPPAGYELDLHRTFVLGPWGLIMDLDDLWDECDELAIGARRMRTLSRPNRFMHACYHAALGDWPLRLGSLRDVAEILSRLSGAETPTRERAARWGAEAVVAAAVSDAHRLLGLPVGGNLAYWAREYTPTRRDESWLALHTRADKTFAAQALATVWALPVWRDKATYLRALLLPDRRYRTGRHASALRRFFYGIREARRGLRSASR